MVSWIPVGTLVGRILLAAIFVWSGFGKVTGFEGAVGYIASRGLPAPELLCIAAIVVELGGGIALILGWKGHWVAAALFLFTGMAALLFHDFWAVPPDQAQMQMINFMKNVAIMGGLLYVVVHGSGPISLDRGAAVAR